MSLSLLSVCEYLLSVKEEEKGTEPILGEVLKHIQEHHILSHSSVCLSVGRTHMSTDSLRDGKGEK